MSIVNKDLEKIKNEEKNILSDNKQNYSFVYNNNNNVITTNIKNEFLKLDVCINKVDENSNNNNNEHTNYYSKIFSFNELLKINDIFKGCNNIKDIKKILDNIFINKPLIEIEENNIKINIKETVTYSFDINLPKTDKNIYEQKIEEIDKKQENNINNINNNHIPDKDKNKYIIINNINFNIKSNIDDNNDKMNNQNEILKKRIITLEENQKKFRNLLEELEKDKENRIKLLEEQLNKIKDKINKEETNSISHLFFDEKLKKGLNGKSEPINIFNNINNKNQLDKNNNNPLNTIPILNNNNTFTEKNNDNYNKSNDNIIQEQKSDNNNNNNSNNNVRSMSGFFKSIHNNIKNKLKNDINKVEKKESEEEEEEENNYLYSNSENEVIDDIQFFDKHNSKQKLIENNITPLDNDNNNNNNSLLGKKRKDNNRKEINLSFSRKSEEFSSDEIMLNSKIVSFFEDYEFLFNYLKNDLNLDVTKAIKIFRATENGDQADTFHSICDNNTNVIVLIKTKDNSKFGGFTSKGFNSNNVDRVDNSAFVFSIDKKEIYPVKNDEKAISCYRNIGPSFTQIIYIPDRFFSGYSHTYIKQLNYKTNEDYQLNHGNKYFKIEELEILELLINE